jgi:hypothetical protein
MRKILLQAFSTAFLKPASWSKKIQSRSILVSLGYNYLQVGEGNGRATKIRGQCALGEGYIPILIAKKYI